jgi:transcriptional regulator with XRE-family HTH domain
VAAELDIDFTYLSKLENDRGEPPGEDTIRGLSTIFGVDPEELLALAGKIPAALKERAQQDPEFAVFLRRLANLSPEKLKSFYKAAGVKAPKP